MELKFGFHNMTYAGLLDLVLRSFELYHKISSKKKQPSALMDLFQKSLF